MFIDSAGYVWHVAKDGNDGNGGHAQQYPVGTSADAKLTIAAAVAAAAVGDTILVWPGTYAENLDLSTKDDCSIIGACGDRSAKIVKAHTGNLLVLGNNTKLENLYIDNTSNATIDRGIINATNGDGGFIIKNCYCRGYRGGLFLTGTPTALTNICEVIDSTIIGGEVALGCFQDMVVRNSIIAGDKSYGSTNVWIISSGKNASMLFDNCKIRGYGVADTTNKKTYAFYVGGSAGYVRISLKNCSVSCDGEGSDFLNLIYLDGGYIHAENTDFRIHMVGADAFNWSSAIPPIITTGDRVNHDGYCYDVIAPVGAYHADKEPGYGVDWETYFTLITFTDYPIRSANNRGEIRLTNCMVKPEYLGNRATENADINGRMDIVNAPNATGITAFVTAIFAKSGITAGGTWTFAKVLKVMTAWAAGKWQDKSGSPGTYEVLDPDDGTTVIAEITPSVTTPQKQVTIL